MRGSFAGKEPQTFKTEVAEAVIGDFARFRNELKNLTTKI